MDFVKLNNRWIYALTLAVFFRNFVSLILISALNGAIAVGQGLLGPLGLILVPVNLYLFIVTLMITHRTVVTGKGVPMNDAFEITPAFKTYFWQYLGMSLLPVVIIAVGVYTIIINYPPRFGLMESILLITGLAYGCYYLMLSFFGTSLTATAVGGDGMMMISRGRITFFYSLIRHILLPMLVIAAILGGAWYYFDQMTPVQLQAWVYATATLLMSSKLYIGLFILASQMLSLFLILISGVILTKAFVLAELEMASRGEVSNWAARAFNIRQETDEVVFV